ncbi:hypothetical protein [Meiothermus granaticius]|uniref:DUF1772 domain-containing protein n=1 Tax=Meiothermus granaticius NBRC 107808 TaxID=1227551 RepID=A0A399FAC3_9DEIN|nr:hypothetical protein [Meiothermus granaticius]MCL6527553.1 hypothetical protein [Thermaceae bacterium]RIH93544.1 hypothetical protein Mgrana_00598 [Meiothermus granaticius NBRC 107808]GEM86040.1 hypothetical protein MGR01S_06650 [Meiothermus granaticius NBRC 107808]
MDAPSWLLLATTVLFLYATGGSWMLQVVSYPTYALVGEREFVPFHKDSGRRLMPVFILPAVVACLFAVALVFWRSTAMPLWAALVAAGGGLVILGTTFALEVPKHNRLDAEGKSLALIAGLIRDNLPRSLAWTLGSAVLVFTRIYCCPGEGPSVERVSLGARAGHPPHQQFVEPREIHPRHHSPVLSS